MLTIYPDCDLSRPSLPPASPLYPLEPLGVGTPLVEGVTSYVIRLADAHAVFPIRLIQQCVLPHLVAEPGHHPATARLGYVWGANGIVLNGLWDSTARWSAVLVDLTGSASLTAGTLLRWRDVLAVSHLLRCTHAWCPQCYAAWHAAGDPLYAPLVWSIAVVTICPQHGTSLQEHCPTCGATIPSLHPQACPGQCPHCDTLLIHPPPDVAPAPDPWTVWVAQQVGALLAAPRTDPPPPRAHVAAVVRAVGDQVPTRKQVRELARRIGVSASAVTQWRGEHTLPELKNWLRLAAVLHTSLVAMLTTTPAPPIPDAYPHVPTPQPTTPRSLPHRVLDRAAIHAALTQVLADPREPPPSMRAVGRQVEYNPNHLRYAFPDLCKAISARYQAYRHVQSLARRQAITTQIHAAVAMVDAQGHAPTLTRVMALVPIRGVVRDPLARQVWRAEVERLGWQPKSGSTGHKKNA